MTNFNIDRAIDICYNYNPDLVYEYETVNILDSVDKLSRDSMDTLCQYSETYFQSETYILGCGVVVGNIDDYNADVRRLAADHGKEFLAMVIS